ncbi:MAG: transketolase C-terminal domain-containing protein, partial [Deltaproteobacteria bacterium]
RLMTQFAYEHDGPIAMRYPRGNTTAWDESATEPIQLGKGMVLQDGSDVAIFAVGVMVETAIAVAEILKEQGLSVAVINAGLSVTKIVGNITERLKELTPRIQKRSKTVKKVS